MLAACSDSTGPLRGDNDIHGRVIDADGQPVWGAAIVVQHVFLPVPGNSPDKMDIAWTFEVLREGPVHAGIYSFCGMEPIRTLIDETRPAGTCAVSWNGLDDEGRIMPAGVYRFVVRTAYFGMVESFALARSGYDSSLTPFDVAALTTTDGAGAFQIDSYCLALDREFPTYDDSGAPMGVQVITPRVRVWVFCEGYPPVAADWVKVDAKRGAWVTVRLPRAEVAR